MRYQSDHKEHTRRRIVKNAARRLRADGLKGAGVAELMKASGLTVGGFYKHFRGKEDLLAQGIEEAFADFQETAFAAVQKVPAGERWKELVRWYLSPEHCDHPDRGCPMAALAPELARVRPAVKKQVAQIMKTARTRMLEFMPGRNAAEKERSFNIIFPSMAGAVAAARVLPDPAERQKILSSVRDHLLENF